MPKRIARHLHFKGPFKARLKGKTLLRLIANHFQIENEIYWYGLESGHESKSMAIWIEYCKTFQPKEILDIGANTGVYGLVAKAISPMAKVSFFEPIPAAIKILNDNLQLNKFSGKIFDIALSNYKGEGHFYMESRHDMEYGITLNENTNESFTRISGGDVEYKKLKVKVEKVSALIANSEIDSPSLVKIDVETHEPEVLEGFESYLNEDIAFLIEVLSEENAIRLNKIFSNFNLEFYNIDDLKSTVRRTDVIVQSDFYNYFICKPTVARKMKSLNTLE